MNTIPQVAILLLITYGARAKPSSAWDAECAKTLENVRDCWLDYPNLPQCGISSGSVLCAEEEIQDRAITMCSKTFQDDIKATQDLYVAVQEAMCENEEIYNSFSSQLTCWITMRSCSGQIHKWPEFDSPNINDNCQQCVFHADECARQDPVCHELHFDLTRSICKRMFCPSLSEEEMDQFFVGLSLSNINRVNILVIMIIAVFISRL